MRRAHDPARLGGRRLRGCRQTQQQRGDAGGLRGQGQLAAGDEIELARVAKNFQHHGAERIAGQRVGGGPQRGVDIGGAHDHQQARIEAEFGQPRHRQRARFNLTKILPHPDQRPARGDPSGEAGDESARRRTLMSLGEHFMHRRLRQPAAQRRIGVGMAERDLVGRIRLARRLDALDAAAQGRKRACACAAHAPFPQDFGPLQVC